MRNYKLGDASRGFWRIAVSACGGQALSLCHALFVVQAQEPNGHSRLRRERTDHCTVQLEVIGPVMDAWIEKWNKLAGDRIEGANVWAFVSITPHTGQGEIPFLCRPAVLARDNMVRLMSVQDDRLRQ